MASYVGKGYRRDRGPDGHGQLSQIELYSPAGCCVRCANPKDGSLEEESERLNKEHHEYMLVTHDLEEQGVEFFPLYERDFARTARLGIKLVRSDARSHEWEEWGHLPVQERRRVADRKSAEYYRSHGLMPGGLRPLQ
jgi:beta-glucosidase/6-phospho-beta-glucosidase/beta-galactosidase